MQTHITNLDTIRETLTTECSDFIIESSGRGMMKHMPTDHSNSLKRNKVRFKKEANLLFEQIFNESFAEEASGGIRTKCVFGNSKLQRDPNKKLCYIFPKNGYKYMFSKQVFCSNEDFDNGFESLIRNFSSLAHARQVIKEILNSTYIFNERLVEALDSGAEVILHSLQCYYSIPTDLVSSYDTFYNYLIYGDPHHG